MEGRKHAIVVRSWFESGSCMERGITPLEYSADMSAYRLRGEVVYHWQGRDREGNALLVTWLPDPTYGAASFRAYEVPLAPTL